MLLNRIAFTPYVRMILSMNWSFIHKLKDIRVPVLTLLYSLVTAASLYIAYEIRFDFSVPPVHLDERMRVLWLVILVKLLALLLARQMGSMVTYFGVSDFFRLALALLVAACLLIIPRFGGYSHYSPPRGVLLIDYLVCLSAFCSFRLSARLFRERVLMGKRFKGRVYARVVIIGAGDTGASLVSDLISTPSRGFRPVAFLDDDRRKHQRFIHGVRVEGVTEDFSHLACLEGVRHAIIAMPSAPAKRVGEIALHLGRLGVQVETVPALEDLASGKARVSRIRPVEIHDLLGREAVKLDTTAIRQFIEGKVVMVTGAGGSIGGELCRQIVTLNPRRLLLVEQSEPSLFLIEQELNDLGFGGTILPVVADILDLSRINNLFDTHAPQIVFHAAAHKHVFLMERQPSEAIKNNAIGTRKLAEVAMKHWAEAFVLISTDKAINPSSVMGASKRLAELHLQALHSVYVASPCAISPTLNRLAGGSNKSHSSEMLSDAGNGARDRADIAVRPTGASSSTVDKHGISQSTESEPFNTKFMAVRFGNVLGSSGSVVPIFKKQIDAGGPVTVTHPDVTRYFMTIPESVGLVLQASVMGNGGEIFVLDMGKPVKIVDLAKNMIELSGYKLGEDIEIKFTGLKSGEKLYEELQHSKEEYQLTEHLRIMRFVNTGDGTQASRMAIEELEPFVDELSTNDLKRHLKVLIPEYEPFLE
jgi:FlaA1/EpsC-like NDP-sugar epimerase